MRILLAPDKFKGSLTARQAAEAMTQGVLRVNPDTQVDICPVADGGEGTVAAMVAALGGRFVTHRVTGPLPEMKVDAIFGMLPDDTAIIEMAAASGLALLPEIDRNPLATTTFGTGELIVEAQRLGATKIILAIGGSATIDGGIGCAQACGLPVLLQDGEPTSPTEPLCGRDLERVVLIKHGRGSPVDRLSFEVAADVVNPLFGPDGAAQVFGPQKGATPDQIQWLDDRLRQLATRTGKLDIAARPGAGAAGGLGFGMMAYFAATLVSGIDYVLKACDFAHRLLNCDLCITGEGRLDTQSSQGKAVHGVAAACREAGVPCVAIVGSVDDTGKHAGAMGLHRIVTLVNDTITPQIAMRDAESLLANRTAEVVTGMELKNR